MNNGWIKLHRSLLDWEWWDNQNTTRLWLTILLSVNHEPKRWRGMLIGAGEMVTSYRKLARLSGLSVRSVRTSLADIVATHEVTCTSTHKCTIIKVVKWAQFQGADSQTDTLTDTGVVSKTTTNKNKEIRSKEKRINNIPPTIAEVTEYCRSRHNNVDPQTFMDFYESKGWMVGKNKMKDWKACIRTWERSDRKHHVVMDAPQYIIDQMNGNIEETPATDDEIAAIKRLQEKL